LDDSTDKKVAEYIAKALDASTDVAILNTDLLNKGDSKTSWLFELELEGGKMNGRQQFVLRLQEPQIMPFAHNIIHEYAILKFLHEKQETVPEPLVVCEDAAIAGQPFYVMPRMAGRTDPHRVVSDLSDTEEGNTLVKDLGKSLARMHSVRPPQEALIFLGTPPESPAKAAIEGCYAYLDQITSRSSALAYPVIEWGLRWLSRNLPEKESVVLCHGDFRLANIMVADKKIAAIMDFEYSNWSDPHEDLATFCMKSARYGAAEMIAGGLANREVLLEAYSLNSKREVDEERLRFWELLANIRTALHFIESGHRYMQGFSPSLDMALVTHNVGALELEILTLVDRAERSKPAVMIKPKESVVKAAKGEEAAKPSKKDEKSEEKEAENEK